MTIDIDTIESKLREIGIVVNRGSLRLHSEQGKVNEVYTIDSDSGRLLLQIGKHSDKDVQLEKVERIYGVSQFLAEHPIIPSSNVLLRGTDSAGHAFTVQEFIEGEKLSDIKDKLKHLEELARILARMHQIDMAQGGHLEFKTGKIQGKHKDWFSFLKNETYRCLEQLYTERKEQDFPKERYLALEHKLDKFFSTYKQYFEGVRGKLLHGDINFGNILVHGERIVALVDLEWSCSGDPAWEFAMYQSVDEACLREYFEELRRLGAEIDEYTFRFRIQLYRIIKVLFIANTYKRTERGAHCLGEFEKTLNYVL